MKAYGAYGPGESFTIRDGMPDVFGNPEANEWRAFKASLRFRLRNGGIEIRNFVDRVYLAYNILIGRV